MLLFRPILALNRRLHAIRIFPFVRANSIVMILLAMVATVAAAESLEVLRSSAEPEPVPLDRILGSKTIENPHVEVNGLVFPRRNVPYTVGADRPPTFVYVAMLHEPTLRVLLVRFPGDLGHGEPRELIVRGMLQPFDAKIARKLEGDGWRIAGLPVERRYVLVAGAGPNSLALFASVGLISTSLAVALIVAMVISRSRTSTEPNPT